MAAAPDLPALDETVPEKRADAFAQAVEFAADSKPATRGFGAKYAGATGSPAESLPLLAKLADDPVPGVRMSALAALASAPWRGRLDLLARKLEDQDPGVAIVAAEGLAHAGDRRASDKLVELSGKRLVRFEALQALYELHEPRFLDLARKAFSSLFGERFDRALAALALAEAGDVAAKDYLLARVAKKRAEERPLLVVHLARALPNEGRAFVERVAADEHDYLRESALLALTRLDDAWWPRTQEAIGRYVDVDPHVSGELLEGLFEIEWERAELIARAHVERETELGQAARRVRLAAALRREFPDEVLLRCD